MPNFKGYFARSFRNPINLAFAVSVLYWIYLGLTTKMIITYDATVYEALGKLIANQGWGEFFRTGPNREPFYPALISFSMGLGKIFGLYYQLIQVVVQLLVLFLTQILTLYILRILKISNLLSALIIIYLGISPAIVNSALSLYSEIVTYPLILVAMLLVYRSWLSFNGPKFRIILLAIATSLLFTLLVLSKGIFEFVIPIFIFLLLVSAFFTRNRKIIINAFAFLLIVFGIFYLLVSGYKTVNLMFNGRFAITNRGAWILYGNTARRMEPLAKERILTAILSVPGEGVCQSVFGEEKCSFWSFKEVDGRGLQKVSDLGNLPPDVVDNTLIALSKQKVLNNPCQYVLLLGLETSKMFFWESTQIGYVIYPKSLTKLFAWVPLKNGMRLVMAFLTFLAVVYLLLLLWRKRKDIFKPESSLILPYFFLLFIYPFVILYSVFGIISRYLLPIVPLFLIIIAYVLQKIFTFCLNKI